jgi:UDP-N-acetylenolpyruvoylglucosamine reductase
MKYETSIIVNIPLNEFVKKIDNQNNMKHWQYGLESFEHISGIPRKIGAKTKLNFKFRKRKMELLETITYIDLPNAFHANYDAKGMHNIQENYFEKTNHGYTKWTKINEFFPTNFMMRIMTIFMKNTFKKQSLIYMKDFKNFVENDISVSQT